MPKRGRGPTASLPERLHDARLGLNGSPDDELSERQEVCVRRRMLNSADYADTMLSWVLQAHEILSQDPSNACWCCVGRCDGRVHIRFAV